MTHYAALPAKQLNQLLEERLFERAPCDHWSEIHMGSAGVAQFRDADNCPHQKGKCFPRNHPTDYLCWAGMGLLIEQMKARGYDVSLNTYHKGTDVDPCHAAFFINRRVEPTDADAADLPTAVAIAALNTTEGNAGAPTTKKGNGQ